MHQYARYFERFRQLAHTRPLEELVSADMLARYRAEVDSEAAQFGVQKPELEIERDIRAKIDASFYQVFQRTQEETSKRWTYEAEIKRPYFHVTELEHHQLINWRKYLDFEEAEGGYQRIVCLYERCLVTCSLYDEFWLRYARWMSAQDNKDEEVRNIYLRAATLFVPISRPGVRLQFAYFEEMCGRVEIARDIHAAILTQLPDCVEAIISWANLQRRQSGLDAAIEVYKAQIDSPVVDIFTKAALVTEWAFLLWKVKGSVDEARASFAKNVDWYADSRHFWQKWLEFELEQPTNADMETQHAERVKNVFAEMSTKSRLSPGIKQELGQVYLSYLQQRGGKQAMKEFLIIDRELFGPQSVSIITKAKQSKESVGLPALDDATRPKAERRFYNYYELHTDPDPNAQGPANFD
jgi:pre-mRNA-processing factor 39